MSDDRQILSSLVRIGLFVVVGKLAATAKEMAVASRYGVSETVDAYLFVFNLVHWPVAVWFSVLGIVLLPLAARVEKDCPSELPRFQAELTGLTLLLAAAVLAAAAIGISALLQTGWLGLPAGFTRLALAMAPWLALLAPLGVFIALYSVWTMNAGSHANTLLEGVPALGILLFVVLLPGSYEALVWGTLAGTAFQLVALTIPARRALAIPRLRLTSPHWAPFWQGFAVMLASQAVVGLIALMDQFFAAGLGSGAISTLAYANRVLALLLGVAATGIGRATLPVFSRAEAAGDAAAHRSAMRWTGLMFLAGSAMLVVSWPLAPWVVALLFERGAFTPADTTAVSHLLQVCLTQLPFYCSSMVLVSYLASRGQQRRIAICGASNFGVKLLALAVLSPLLGIEGIAVSTTVMYALALPILLWAARAQPARPAASPRTGGEAHADARDGN
jgi:peptidoglycan biosynthesis protein MviN/MurJ (putative lipid II flippase)